MVELETSDVRQDALRYQTLRNASMDDRNRLEHYAGPALDEQLDMMIHSAYHTLGDGLV